MAYVSSTTNGETVGGSPTVDVPTGAQAGDTVLLVVTTDHTTAVFDGFWPADFDHLDSVGTFGPDDQVAGMAVKDLTGADTGTYDTTIDCGGNPWGITAVLMRDRKVAATVASVVATDDTANPSPVSITSPGLTALSGDDLLLVECPDQTVNNVATGFVASTNYVQQVDGINLGTGGKSNLGVAVREDVDAGATGDVTGDYEFGSGAAGWATWLVRMPRFVASPTSTWVFLAGCGYAAPTLVNLNTPTCS